MPLFQQDQCSYCREEQIPKCRKAHPEWFYKDTEPCHGMKEDCYDKILAYVNENTPKITCVFFGTNEAYCVKHLKVLTRELRHVMTLPE